MHKLKHSHLVLLHIEKPVGETYLPGLFSVGSKYVADLQAALPHHSNASRHKNRTRNKIKTLDDNAHSVNIYNWN